MVDPALDLYCAAFAARQSHEVGVGQVTPIGPGVRRLLVTDDDGYDRLTTELAAALCEVTVFEQASRCDELMRGSGWNADRPATAMVLRNVQVAANATLPAGLVLRPVAGLTSDVPDAVPLRDAVAVAIASDPGITEPPDEFARFLMRLPASVRLFAAVDDAGVVRATAGCEVFGEYARVFFVNTEPACRRRGIGRAMTVAALHAAASAGAARAVLHATDDAVSVYARLGFEGAGRLTRYSRAV